MGNYLKLFNTQEDYNKHKESASTMPNVSHCIDNINVYLEECAPSIAYELIGNPSYPSTINGMDESFDITFTCKKTTNTIVCSTIVTNETNTVTVYIGKNTSTETDRVISDTFNYNGLLIPYTITQYKRCTANTVYELNGTPSYPSEIEGDVDSFNLTFSYRKIVTDKNCNETVTTGSDTTVIYVGVNPNSGTSRIISDSYNYSGMSVPYTVTQNKMCTAGIVYEQVGDATYPSEIEYNVSAFNLSFSYKKINVDKYCNETVIETSSVTTSITVGENSLYEDRTISSSYTFNGIVINYSLVQKKNNHYQIVNTFNVRSTSNNTNIASNTTPIDCIEIDNTVYRTVSSGFRFSTTGSHTVKYSLKNAIETGGGIFGGCEDLTNSVIEEGVAKIGNSLYAECNNLSSVTIPESTTIIDDGAFFACPNLSKVNSETSYTVNIPNNVTTINNDVFSNCTKIKTVNFNDDSSLTTIGNEAFSRCDMLETINIPSGVTSIGNSAFKASTGLTSVYLNPVEPPIIGASAFTENADDRKIYVTCYSINTYKADEDWSEYTSGIVSEDGCPLVATYNVTSTTEATALRAIWYSENIESMEIDGVELSSPVTSYTFDTIGIHEVKYYPKDQTVTYSGVTFGASATVVPDYMFHNIDKLISIDIPDSFTTIGERAFHGCSGLTTIHFGQRVNNFSTYGVFGNCTSLPVVNNIRYADTYAVEAVDKTLSSYTIKDGTKFIGRNCFASCSGLTSVNLPDSLIKFETNAFWKCSGLTSVTIPNGVTHIGGGAFYYCTSLTNINIPNSVTGIYSGAFRDCSGLTSVTIPDSVTYVDGDIFSDCTSLPVENNIRYADTFVVEATDKTLSTYTIKNTTRFIGNSSFSGCSNLTSITIPSNVTSIGGSVFSNCSNLTSIVIPDNVTSVGSAIFANCTSLTSVTMSPNITVIGQDAFKGCSSLTSVNLSDNITSIGDGAFSGCTSLSSLTIPSGLTSISKYIFYNCSGLTSIIIPDSVVTIASQAFYCCSGLTSINIPNSVVTIASQAFYCCSGLISATIGSGVTYIAMNAFYNCSGLTGITIERTTPPTLVVNALTNTNNCPIYVPAASVDTYKAASGWSSYASRIQPIS